MAKRHQEKDEATDGSSRVTRRSCIQLAGVAMGSALGASAFAGRSNAAEPTVDLSGGDDIAPLLSNVSDGETLVLPQGTYDLRGDVSIDADDFTVHGNGSVIRTYESYGHDLRLDGSNYEFSHMAFEPQNGNDDSVWMTLWPYGSDWHVHHLAWLSEKRVSSDDLGSTIRPGVESGSEGNLTDIWLGAGVGDQQGNSHVHCFGSVDDDLWIRRSYFYQGGVYGANSSSEQVRNEGTTHFEGCYFENCYNTCARTGGHYQDTYIRDCVMNLSDRDDVPSKPSYSDSYFRGVWAWHGPVILENVHINGAADRALAVEDRQIVQESYIDYRSGAYTGAIQHPDKVQVDSSVDSDPRTDPPDDCVTSAEEAYVPADQGSGRTGDDTDGDTDGGTAEYDHTLEVRGTGTATNYEFAVDGDLAGGGDLEQWDSIEGSSASGWVTEQGHVDTFRFTGSVASFAFAQGEAEVLLDGEQVDPASFGESEHDHTLAVRGTGTATNYEFTVDGELSGGGDLEQWDSVDGSSASGWVTDPDHTDTFQFTGSVTSFAFAQGEAEVLLDGEQVDPTSLTDDGSDESGDDTLPKRIVIDGTRVDGPATYTFEVSGEVQPHADRDDLEAEDAIEGSTVTGTIGNDLDTYRYSGAILSLNVDGAATARLGSADQ
ncbi:hypothetical protein Hbl1158_15110 (plasmid) [Halobaculum sp. CBA1158]|uniref:hypothetical protein n=1 Tax=Halobaculum sp. CBA1158 TaxID=2904243 RepID=UPI001F38CBD0|nr:hypothetical protein [Halobaculum sp. CBA1158]UIP01464.1 hypothetical protein Hbl1158_15110 [Halobaculum sp. CBA1158]